jgi:arylsulfatase
MDSAKFACPSEIRPSEIPAVKMTVPAAFTASESFDVGRDLGSTVSRDYYERRPFKFDGRIGTVKVSLK